MIIEEGQSPFYIFTIRDDSGEVIARASLFCITNELHENPYGLLEDVFVEEAHRKKGLAKQLVEKVIDKAQELGHYKLVATSRYERLLVHKLYGEIGFEDHGKSFRINLC